MHIMLPVFNLTVEEEHCYYANGVLTHNCDTMTQALLHLRNIGFAQKPVEIVAEKTESMLYRPQRKSQLYPV